MPVSFRRIDSRFRAFVRRVHDVIEGRVGVGRIAGIGVPVIDRVEFVYSNDAFRAVLLGLMP